MKKNIKKRFYRNFVRENELIKFEVRIEESDLFIMAEKNLKREAEEELSLQRRILKDYIIKDAEFYTSFSPRPVEKSAPEIVKLMSQSSFLTNTGPMASVAGAIAEKVGEKLLKFSNQVIVENGGDIYLKTNKECIVGIFAGNSPFSMKIGIKILPSPFPKGIATSSGKIGHSFSYGNADSVTVVSNSATFSDGAATYFGNLVKSPDDFMKILEEIKNFPFVEGILIIFEEELFAWGEIELVYL